MSKSSYHVQRGGIDSWLRDAIRRSGVDWLKLMHPDEYAAPPIEGVKYIGRLWWHGEPDRRLVYQGAAGADAWWRMAWPKLQRCPWCDVIEGPNEPKIETVEQARAIAAFERRRTDLLHQHNFESASYCFGEGNPELKLWQYLGAGIGDYLALHEYGMKAMTWDGWHLGRYRFVLRELAEAGYPTPRILITETGIDYSGDPEKDGWQEHATEDQYLYQLKDTSAEWDQDPEIIAAFPFTWNEDGWPSFDHPESFTRKYADWLCDDNMVQPAVGEILAELGQADMIPHNYDAALMRAGTERGMYPITGERQETIGGQLYVSQGFMRSGLQHWAHCAHGDWGNIVWTEREN